MKNSDIKHENNMHYNYEHLPNMLCGCSDGKILHGLTLEEAYGENSKLATNQTDE